MIRDELEPVTDALCRASAEVLSEYFRLPVAGQEERAYRERVYCYELYHRWRCNWPAGSVFTLSAEVDKAGHPVIRGDDKPDFLVHVPGQMANLLIIEVKPATASIDRMVRDLNKLIRFRREVGYSAAYFWMYGDGIEWWKTRREELLGSHELTEDFEAAGVSCFLHVRAGLPAIRLN